jgi:hypothetical protein
MFIRKTELTEVLGRMVITMGVLSTILGLFGCKIDKAPDSPISNANNSTHAGDSQTLVAERITIKDLPVELQKLKDGKTEFDFTGITSNGIDCIYFEKDGDNFQIVFEAMGEDQFQYIEKLKNFSTAKGYKFEMTTYGNKPQDHFAATAPVIQIKSHSDIKTSAELGRIIQESIFQNNSDTVYAVVP